MPSLNSLCGGAAKNGESSPLGSSTGPGCKALVFIIVVQYFFQNKMRHLSSGTSTATLRMMAPHCEQHTEVFTDGRDHPQPMLIIGNENTKKKLVA